MKIFSVKYLIILFFTIVLFTYCDKKIKYNADELLSINKISKNYCSNDSLNTYYEYIPTKYSIAKKWPVIFCFDPHGDGFSPLDSIKEIAEKFGFILIGSNTISNSTQNIDQTLSVLFDDVFKKYSIDNRRVFICGFSGGARIALSAAINLNKINGIIMCGAGITQPLPELNKLLNVYLVVGNQDFNYREVVNSNNFFNTSYNYHIEVFNGQHRWPPEHELHKAILWLLFNDMRKSFIEKDYDLINLFYNQSISNLKNYENDKQFVKAYNAAKNGFDFLKDLHNTKVFQKKMKKLIKEKAFKEEKNKISSIFYKENLLQDQYLNSYLTKDTAWWKNELKSIENIYNSEKDEEMRALYKRILSFLGIAGYSLTKQYIVNHDFITANKVILIYEIIEPDNPDCLFFKAILKYKSGNNKEAQELFKQAKNKGFNDINLTRQMMPNFN